MFPLDYAIVSQIQVLQTEQKIHLIFKNQQLYGNRVKREYEGETVWRCHGLEVSPRGKVRPWALPPGLRRTGAEKQRRVPPPAGNRGS